jgi:hypothetical protein
MTSHDNIRKHKFREGFLFGKTKFAGCSTLDFDFLIFFLGEVEYLTNGVSGRIFDSCDPQNERLLLLLICSTR